MHPKYHDTHIHLDILSEKLFEIEKIRDSNTLDNDLTIQQKHVLKNLLKNHEFALQSTISTDNYLFVKRLFGDLKNVFYFLGSHPEEVKSEFCVSQYLSRQKNILENDKSILETIVGIGEIGLDYFHTQDKEFIKKQQELFESQIQLAIDNDLPIMIHCREAFEDTFSILRSFPQIHNCFLIHCFTGGVVELEQIIQMGGKVGIGGVASFNSAKNLQEAVKICPNDSLVLETDLPFLAPTPYRGKVCLPGYVDNVAQKIAELKNLTKEEVWSFSRKNTISLFPRVSCL